MQQAYVAEANEYGSWKLIGYTAPNSGETNNFEYTATALAGDGASSKDAEDNVWEAANKALMQSVLMVKTLIRLKLTVQDVKHLLLHSARLVNNFSDLFKVVV